MFAVKQKGFSFAAVHLRSSYMSRDLKKKTLTHGVATDVSNHDSDLLHNVSSHTFCFCLFVFLVLRFIYFILFFFFLIPSHSLNVAVEMMLNPRLGLQSPTSSEDYSCIYTAGQSDSIEVLSQI